MKQMNKKIVLLIVLTVMVNFTNAQEIYNHVKDKGTQLTARNIVNELLLLQDEANRQKIVILPVYNNNSEIAEDSKFLSDKIVHHLNLLFEQEHLNFGAVNFYKDPLLVKKMDETTVQEGNESEYYKELLQKYRIDYFVTAVYSTDFGNNLVIENITIHSNYLKKDVTKKQYSVKSVKVANSSGFAPIWRSALVPGWGQLYKKQKAKGYTLLFSEVLFITAAFISQNQYDYNNNEAIKNIKHPETYYYYTDKADVWKTTRNAAFIGAGAVYLYSIIDAIATRGAKSYAYTKPRKFYIFPNYKQNAYQLTATINF